MRDNMLAAHHRGMAAMKSGRGSFPVGMNIAMAAYTRARVGPDKDLPPEQGVELTQVGYEFWPEALGAVIRYASSQAKVPVYVTENGVATEDDTRRIEYIKRALAGVRQTAKPRNEGPNRVPRSWVKSLERTRLLN